MAFLMQFLNLATLVSGLLVITAESPIVSVLYLIVVFICAACYLVLAGLPYLGVVYIVVYVGAIAILFIFILMMINLQSSDIIESSYEFNVKLPLTLLLASGFFLEVYYIMNNNYKHIQWENIPETLYSTFNLGIFENVLSSNTIKANTYYLNTLDNSVESSLSQLQHIQSIGDSLYTQNAFWIILSSVIFLLGMISPIVLSRKA